VLACYVLILQKADTFGKTYLDTAIIT